MVKNSLLLKCALALPLLTLTGCANKSPITPVVAEPVRLPLLSRTVENLRHKSSAGYSQKVSNFLKKVEHSTNSETPK